MLAPPKIAAPATTGMAPSVIRWTSILVASCVVAAMVVLYFFNPTKYNFYPVCQFHRLTGLNCPGCGATRSLYALLHGNFRLAFRDNVLLLVLMFFGGLRWLWVQFLRRQRKASVDLLPTWLLWTLLAVTVAFGIVRNLPGFEWLSPV